MVYTPPQTAQDIIDLMSDLEKFINDDELSDYDDLVKMALIHHHFESIHPFYDGINMAMVGQDRFDKLIWCSTYIFDKVKRDHLANMMHQN